MQRLFQNVFISLLIPLVFGCGLVPPSNTLPPKLGLSDLAIKELGLSEIKFIATVAADNPNTFTMPLANTKLELLLFGQSIATGITQSNKIELAASTATPVPVEFIVSTAKIVNLLRQIGRGQGSQLSYQLKGNTQWGPLGIPLSFERKGDFDAVKKLGELVR